MISAVLLVAPCTDQISIPANCPPWRFFFSVGSLPLTFDSMGLKLIHTEKPVAFLCSLQNCTKHLRVKEKKGKTIVVAFAFDTAQSWDS